MERREKVEGEAGEWREGGREGYRGSHLLDVN